MELKRVAGFEHIYYIDGFWKGIQSIFNKSKLSYKVFLENFNLKLSILELSGKNCTLTHPNDFEILKNTDNLYVIRYKKRPHNIRILFTLYYSQDDDKIILLYGFQEKSKSDYDIAIKKAQGLLKQLEEVNYND